MSFERANIVPQNFCILGNWLSFQNPQTLSRKKQSLHHEKDYHRVIRWIFLLKFLYGWDFPSSHKVHTDQGKTLLRRLCVQWGLPLKSHECLQKISVFNTKYHLNLLRILLYKEIEKALHCCEISFCVLTNSSVFLTVEDVDYRNVLWKQVYKFFPRVLLSTGGR